MARRRHTNRSNPNLRRDASVHHHTRFRNKIVRRVPQIVIPRFAPLRVYEDRRYWRPEPLKLRPLFASPRSSGRIVAAPSTATATERQLSYKLTFQDVTRVGLCVRREERKRVMHAIGAAGGKVRPPRRNPWSELSCKR